MEALNKCYTIKQMCDKYRVPQSYITLCLSKNYFPHHFAFGNEVAIPECDIEIFEQRYERDKQTGKIAGIGDNDLEGDILKQFLTDDCDSVKNQLDEINNPSVGSCRIHGDIMQNEANPIKIGNFKLCPKCFMLMFKKNNGQLLH